MTSNDDGPVDPFALGLAAGVLWAVAMAVLGLTSRFGWGDGWRELFADLYIGYEESTTIGTAWGFVDGFAAGYILGWLYNLFARR
ncbi:bacteriophage holin [Natrialbaceae archaeon AArc-T1-2]|uniref:bacteriophage holin n=1 Tax=Natrialbaceae archaeon AArc-T1-2 TaxID=3053904 RepID=UPI00255AF685|nr:bacteriophage holin [Natrialbaceae archaeon AArc-T1-2]WIV68326.1 bacteriophage holin [Natrialbaceae archaeon AArc-T1-2]